MKAKQEQVLMLLAIGVALCVPIKITAFIVVLVLIVFFRAQIWNGLLAIVRFVGDLFGSLRGKHESGSSPPMTPKLPDRPEGS